MNLARPGFIIALFVASIGILGQWVGNDWEYAWRIPAAALVFALLLEYLHHRKKIPDVQQHVKRPVYLGRHFKLNVETKNRAARPIEVDTFLQLPDNVHSTKDTLYWRIKSLGQSQQKIDLLPTTLGEISWQNIYTRTLGLFGLAKWSKKLHAPTATKVVPDHLHEFSYSAGNPNAGTHVLNLIGAGNELYGLRPYQAGDPIRHIDWKATAKTRSPTVRLFSQELRMELMIIIDIGKISALYTDHLSRLHRFINVAARLAELAAHNGDAVGVASFAETINTLIPPATGRKHLSRVRSALSSLSATPLESNPLAAALHLKSILKRRCLIIFLTDIKEPEASEQLIKGARLLTTKHACLVADIIDENILSMREKMANDWLDPYRILASIKIEQSLKVTSLQLERLGLHVVRERAELLDHAVLAYYQKLKQKKLI